MMKKDIRMYVCTHKQFYSPIKEYYPLHCGRALSKDIGYPGDDTGDNISEKNISYAELTGLYWIWKNVKCDIVGVSHYRRYFMDPGEEQYIDYEYIADLLEKYDVILPNSHIKNHTSLWELYDKSHRIKDLEVVYSVITKHHPDYVLPFDICIKKCGMFSPCNMMICRKEIFDTYCEWLFSIFFEAEKIISKFDPPTKEQQRIFGFMGERMNRIWLMNQPVRILELPVVLTTGNF